MRAPYEADSSDDGSPGWFTSLRSAQGAAPLAPQERFGLRKPDAIPRQLRIGGIGKRSRITAALPDGE